MIQSVIGCFFLGLLLIVAAIIIFWAIGRCLYRGANAVGFDPSQIDLPNDEYMDGWEREGFYAVSGFCASLMGLFIIGIVSGIGALVMLAFRGHS